MNLFPGAQARLRSFFDESPGGLRRLVLLLYAIVGPVFAGTLFLQSGSDGADRAYLVAVILMIVAAAAWVFVRRSPRLIDWFYPVSIAPTVCCGIAFVGSQEFGITVLAAPIVWAAILFPMPIAAAAWLTATVTCFVALVAHTGHVGGAIESTIVFSAISGLVAWVVFQNAHTLRQTSVQLRIKDARRQTLFAAMSEGVVVQDTSGKIVECNPVATSILGLTRDQLLGRTSTDPRWHTIHEDSSDFSGQEHPAMVALSTGRSMHNVIMGIDKPDGERTWISINAEPIFYPDAKQPAAVVTSFHDITAIRAAEATLRESETYLRLLLDNTSAGVMIVDKQTRIIEQANPAALALMGQSPDKVIGAVCHHFVCPADQNKCPILDLNQQVDNSERIVLRADGSQVPVLKSVTRVQIGGREKLLETFIDITAQKEAQQRFERLFRNNPSLMALTDLQTDKFVDVNQAFLTTLGYTQAEIIGKTTADLNLFTDADEQKRVGRILAEHGAIRDFELQVRCKDGTIRTGLFSGEIINIQGTHFFLTVMVDITAKKAAEEELQHLAARLSLATRAGGIGVWDYDIVNNILLWDEQMMLLYGVKKEEFGGAYEAWRKGLHPDDLTRGDDEIAMAIRGDKEFDTEFRVVWPDGSIHTIRANAIVQRDTTGKALRMIGTNWDISRQKESEEFLRQMNDYLEESNAGAAELAMQAEKANAAKSDFLATMSHEIRTPMNGVIGMTGLLLDTPLTDKQRHYVEIAKSSGESLLALINDILDFSKIEAGKLDFEQIGFDLQETMNSCAMGFEYISRTKGLTLLWTINPDVPVRLVGDATRLRQILTNLIGNAIKFTEKGSVVVGCTLEADQQDGCVVRFSVQDSGVGIAKDKQHLLFRHFAQADASMTRKYGGTGLGLAICKRLAEMMGGSIGFESTPGVGSTFWFILHFTKQKDSPTAGTAGKTLAGGAGTPDGPRNAGSNPWETTRILLAEDNVTNQEVARGILNKLGFKLITVCADGHETIRTLEKERFDLVLMDVFMPGMDGLQAARIIRDPTSAVLQHAIPVIAMTAGAMKEDRDKCIAAGMIDHITKPLVPKNVLEIISRRLLRIDAVASAPVNPAPFADSAVGFNYDNLMERLDSDIDLIEKVVAIAVREIPRQIDKLRQAFAGRDCKSIELHAHSIKGAAANIGLEHLRLIAEKIEYGARAGDYALISRFIPGIADYFEAAVSAIRKKIPALLPQLDDSGAQQ
jgi:PAS domain S-box-containing protein